MIFDITFLPNLLMSVLKLKVIELISELFTSLINFMMFLIIFLCFLILWFFLTKNKKFFLLIFWTLLLKLSLEIFKWIFILRIFNFLKSRFPVIRFQIFIARWFFHLFTIRILLNPFLLLLLIMNKSSFDCIEIFS